MTDSLPRPPADALFEDATVTSLVAAETARARTLHNFSMEHSGNERCLRILVEEVGDVAEAIEDLIVQEQAVPIDIAKLDHAERRLLEEIVQVASAAGRWAATRLRAMSTAMVDPVVEVKRFFTFNISGADYSLVAADAEHAVRLLDGVEFGDPSVPFSEAKDEDGDPLALIEIPASKAALIPVCVTEQSPPIPLTECELGTWFCTEY